MLHWGVFANSAAHLYQNYIEEHKKNVTKFLGHHYAIWASDSNFLLAQKISGTGRPCLLMDRDKMSNL